MAQGFDAAGKPCSHFLESLSIPYSDAMNSGAMKCVSETEIMNEKKTGFFSSLGERIIDSLSAAGLHNPCSPFDPYVYYMDEKNSVDHIDIDHITEASCQGRCELQEEYLAELESAAESGLSEQDSWRFNQELPVRSQSGK